MTVIKWSPFVNRELYLEGGYGYEEDFVKSLKFDSGKDRSYLKNSYVPKVYPAVSVILDNEIPVGSGGTEFSQFVKWFEQETRYGTLPFYFPVIGRKNSEHEYGVYQFTSPPKYEDTDGQVPVTFGLREVSNEPSYIEPDRFFLWITEDQKYCIDGQGRHIIF